MDKKPSKPGLSSGEIPSAGSTADGVAMFRKNGLNHPLTREPLALRELGAAKQDEVTDEEALALFRKNQLNHPMTRVPYAMQVRDRLAAKKKPKS